MCIEDLPTAKDAQKAVAKNIENMVCYSILKNIEMNITKTTVFCDEKIFLSIIADKLNKKGYKIKQLTYGGGSNNVNAAVKSFLITW